MLLHFAFRKQHFQIEVLNPDISLHEYGWESLIHGSPARTHIFQVFPRMQDSNHSSLAQFPTVFVVKEFQSWELK